MKVLMLTNEFPPYTYGGAGAHVEYLSRELSRLIPVEVRCFGDQKFERENLKVHGVPLGTIPFGAPKPLHSIFGAVQRCLNMNSDGLDHSPRDILG